MKAIDVTGVGTNADPVRLYSKVDDVARRYEYDDEDWVVNLFGAYKFREIMPKSWYGNGVELPFEDTSVLCPFEYDKVLTQLYGDYMTPPPESERGANHSMEIMSLG